MIVIYFLLVLITLQDLHQVALFIVVPATINYNLSRSTTNLFANDSFSVFVELENNDINQSEMFFNFISKDRNNQYVYILCSKQFFYLCKKIKIKLD